jgi:mRNA interferase MazF
MMIIRPGEFWVANIPFTDGSGFNRRSVLVMWMDVSDAVVAAVSTSAPRSPTDVPLADWQASGLRRPSIVRLWRLDCLEQSLLVARIGVISDADGRTVRQIWSAHVGPQF